MKPNEDMPNGNDSNAGGENALQAPDRSPDRFRIKFRRFRTDCPLKAQCPASMIRPGIFPEPSGHPSLCGTVRSPLIHFDPRDCGAAASYTHPADPRRRRIRRTVTQHTRRRGRPVRAGGPVFSAETAVSMSRVPESSRICPPAQTGIGIQRTGRQQKKKARRSSTVKPFHQSG